VCSWFGRAFSTPDAAPAGWLLRAGGVLLAGAFFARLHIWNYDDPAVTLGQRAELLHSFLAIS
jgi:hypothetical protein